MRHCEYPWSLFLVHNSNIKGRIWGYVNADKSQTIGSPCWTSLSFCKCCTKFFLCSMTCQRPHSLQMAKYSRQSMQARQYLAEGEPFTSYNHLWHYHIGTIETNSCWSTHRPDISYSMNELDFKVTNLITGMNCTTNVPFGFGSVKTLRPLSQRPLSHIHYVNSLSILSSLSSMYAKTEA